MKSNESRQAIPLIELINDSGLTREDLKSTIDNLKINLLCRCPRNVEFYVSGSAIISKHNEPKTLQSLFKRHSGTPFCKEHDHYAKAELDVKFFALPPLMWEEIISYGEASICSLEHVYFHTRQNGLEGISAKEQLRNSLKPLASLVIDAKFFIASESETVQPSEISITESQLAIRSTDALQIINILSNTTSRPRKEWESSMLSDLNEASDRFISGAESLLESDKETLLREIEIWLLARWEKPGEILLKQAALAIIPDKLYGNAPSKKPDNSTIKKYPPYASTSLIAINETAVFFWRRSQEQTRKPFPKRDELLRYLMEEYGLTVRLAGSAAAIISLKPRR